LEPYITELDKTVGTNARELLMRTSYQKWQQSARSLSTSLGECGNLLDEDEDENEHFPPPLILRKCGAAVSFFFGEQ